MRAPQLIKAGLVILTLLAAGACQSPATSASEPAAETGAAAPAAAPVAAQGGLQITDTVVGEGATAVPGTNIVVHYTGWLFDPAAPDNKGKKFDSSLDRNQPFVFPLGAGRVIKGWEQGFDGMQVGGKRTLIIPPEMGYGARGAGAAIPPNSTLLFDVELLDVR